MSTTVVTAFYRLEKSKHSDAEYFGWIKNFFRFTTSPVVCFCDNASILREFQVHPHVTFIELPLIGSYKLTSPEWVTKWTDQYVMDPEINIHSPYLYMVWALKQEFVEKAIEMKKYDSSYYVWCDIGCFRSPENFPQGCRFAERTPEFVTPGKLSVLRITYPNNLEFIGAGVLAGDTTAWKNFSSQYCDTLKLFESRNCFYGKEQDVYKFMVYKTPENFTVVTTCDWGVSRNGKIDSKWFYMTRLLSL